MSPRFFLTVLAGSALALGPARAQSTTRMSTDIAGNQGLGFNQYIGISRDASFVVFTSDAANLVPGDTNGQVDLFAKDVKTGAISRLSVGPGGVQGNGFAGGVPAISANGGLVAFESFASNLVAGDTNGKTDIFVRNTMTGTTTRVSLDAGGNEANGHSNFPAISADGRYVSFTSFATNLVPGDTNGVEDVYVKDLQTGAIARTSVSTGGAQPNAPCGTSSISGDGRYVVFHTLANTLVAGDTNGLLDVFVRDTVALTTSRVSVATGGAQANGASVVDGNASISDDGRWVVFTSSATNFAGNDTNGVTDIYLRDLQTATTYFLSGYNGTVPNGFCTRPRISADGGTCVWETAATNLVTPDTNGVTDIIVSGPLGLVRASVSTAGAEANGGSLLAGLSGDGKVVVFESGATNLVPGDTNGTTDVFLRDLRVANTACNARQSLSAAGAEGNGDSLAGYVSGDGKWVGFESAASNLVPADFNGVSDVFLKNREDHSILRCSVSSGGVEGDAPSHAPSVSQSGRWVAFASSATNLVAGDTNFLDDVFVHDTTTGATVRVSIDSNGAEADGPSYVPPWGNPSISPDGRYVAFTSAATNLVAGDTNFVNDVFVHDRDLDGNGVFDEQIPGRIRTVRVSIASGVNGAQGDGPSGPYGLWISAFGRRVAFASVATNLVPGDLNFSDIFVRNLQTNTTTLVSVDSSEVQAFGFHHAPSISADLTLANDGRYVSFASDSAGLVPGDTNGVMDVFLRDVTAGLTTRVSVSSAGGETESNSELSMVEASGRYVVFESSSGVLDPVNDPESSFDVFLRDRQLGTTECVSRPSNAGDAHRPTVSVGAAAIAFDDTGAIEPDDFNAYLDVYVRACDPPTPMVSFCFPGEHGTRACPCGNPPTGSGRGCNNFGAGPADSGKLTATGTASLGADTVVFTSAGENNTSTTVLIQAKTAVFGGVVFGAGVRCASGTLKRLYTGAASVGSFTRPSASDPTSVSARSAAQGDSILAGEHRYYFGYYRDPTAAGPCGNATSTFNCTQAGDVEWAP